MSRGFDNGIDRLETHWTFGDEEEVILPNSMAQIPVPRSKSGKAQRTLISILTSCDVKNMLGIGSDRRKMKLSLKSHAHQGVL